MSINILCPLMCHRSYVYLLNRLLSKICTLDNFCFSWFLIHSINWQGQVLWLLHCCRYESKSVGPPKHFWKKCKKAIHYVSSLFEMKRCKSLPYPLLLLLQPLSFNDTFTFSPILLHTKLAAAFWAKCTHCWQYLLYKKVN